MPRPLTPLIAGNWKMVGSRAAMAEVRALLPVAGAVARHVEVVLMPPAPYLLAAQEVIGSGPIALGGQTCHPQPSGAHTGEISAVMLADCGATWVIVGHSERRADCHESNGDVAARAQAALDAGLRVILCVGESEHERATGEAENAVRRQLAQSLPARASFSSENLVIAYEPIWAIGTGQVPTLAEISAMHAMIRQEMASHIPDGAMARILYGGSVKPANAREILDLPEVNGALVGGASLKAVDFAVIIQAALQKEMLEAVR